MSLANASPPVQQTLTLEELVTEISRFEAIIAEWDESQRSVVVGLKRAIEDLHKEALVRLIRSVKQESMAALLHAAEWGTALSRTCEATNTTFRSASSVSP